MKRLYLALSALVVTAACSEYTFTAEPRFSAKSTVEIAVDTTGRDRVSVEGINGNIKVTGVPGAASITVRAVIRVEADSQEEADAHLYDVTVEVDTIAPNPEIVRVYTQHLFTNPGGRNYSVDYEVTMPAELEVTVENVNGNCTVESFTTEFVDIRLTNGNARTVDITAFTWVNVVNGNISGNVELIGRQSIKMSAVNGSIDLDIPRSTSAIIEAKALRGGVYVRYLDVLYIERSKFHILGRLGDGAGSIDLGVTNGPIWIMGYQLPMR
jgi:DUF4097 and DUF4098 domain-containing protein YvlB